jgi:uncharacterized membrane protein
MNHFISLAYWLNARPPLISDGSLNMLFISVLILVIIGLAGYLGYLQTLKIPKRISKKLISFCITNAFLICLFIFFDYEIVQYLRSRAVFALIILEALIWLLVIIFSKPKKGFQVNKNSREEEIKRYLPS